MGKTATVIGHERLFLYFFFYRSLGTESSRFSASLTGKLNETYRDEKIVPAAGISAETGGGHDDTRRAVPRSIRRRFIKVS